MSRRWKHRLLAAGSSVFVGALATSLAAAASVSLTPQRMAELQQINAYVNSTVTEVSDQELYGKDDVWALPVNGKGDCEDFALLKQKLLVQRGWPRSALKVAAVHTPQGEAHAVLTAETDKGTLVLDNKVSSIRPASATGYTFLSQQSGKNPSKWVNTNTGEQTDTPTADLPLAVR